MVRMASGTKCAGPFDWPRARNCGAELGIAGLAFRQGIAGSASGTTARGFRPPCCRPHRQPRSRGRFHILLYFMYFCHSIAALSVTAVLQATRLRGAGNQPSAGPTLLKVAARPLAFWTRPGKAELRACRIRRMPPAARWPHRSRYRPALPAYRAPHRCFRRQGRSR